MIHEFVCRHCGYNPVVPAVPNKRLCDACAVVDATEDWKSRERVWEALRRGGFLRMQPTRGCGLKRRYVRGQP